MQEIKYLVFGGDNYNTLGMIRTLGEAHIGVSAIIFASDFIIASKSKYIKELKLVPTVEEGYQEIISYAKKHFNGDKIFLLVEGDYATEYLDAHYEELSKYYFYNQAKGQLGYYMNKHAQVELARKNGFDVLKTWTVDVGYVPEDILYPIITKAINSRNLHWKEEVFICNSEEELLEAYKKIKSEKIILQSFAEKTNELCIDGFSINNGEEQFLAIGSNYNYIIPGKYSYALTMSNYDNQEMKRKITNLMKEVGFEGIYSIEFLIGKDGKHYFLEVNFRNSGWSYASTCAGMPLPILWATGMLLGKVDPNWQKPVKEGFTFIDDFNDFKNRVLTKQISFHKWLKEYKKADCRLTLGRNDVKPMIAYLASRVFRKIKRTISAR